MKIKADASLISKSLKIYNRTTLVYFVVFHGCEVGLWQIPKGSDDGVQYSTSLGFWTLYSKQLEYKTFRKLDLFPSSGEGRDTCSTAS
jgi:hypothetical protein